MSKEESLHLYLSKHWATDILNCGSIGSNITDQKKVEAMKLIYKVSVDLKYK